MRFRLFYLYMQPNPRFTHPASIASGAFIVLVLLAAIALTLPVASHANAKAKTAFTMPSTAAKVNSCVSAPNYADRKIEFSGRMQSYAASPGGKMQMRFDVLRKFNESAHWRLLTADGLGQWLANTEPTATVYVRNIALSQIETSAHYQARVRYRWVDANGKVIARKLRTTKVCKQTTPLPNPFLAGITTYPEPGQSTSTYVVRIENQGLSEAINVPVSLAIDGKPAVTQTIDSIGAGQIVDLRFANMDSCTSERFVRIDPQNVVRERNERFNDTVKPC
jgi:hypothetical protein